MALVGTGWPRGDSKRSCAPQAVAGLGPRRPRCDSNRSCAPQAVAGLEPRRPRRDSDRGGVSMADARLAWLPATELAALIKRKKVSPVEVVDGVLDRIRTINPRLNAFVTLTEESARREAKVAERALMKRGARLGPLHGVPFSVKDLVITRGVRTTFGTPVYRDSVPTEDAPIVERMKGAGGIMLGKTNTPTFGWIGATHNLVFGIPRNPWNLDGPPGGSGGGASGAAAGGLGPLHIGTDGGGSIRIPASCAGIFGHKASYGRIPTYPASGAWSLSHIGPLTRTVADAALMLTVCAGPDERDQYSLPGPRVDYVKALRGNVKGLRVAWWEHPRVFFAKSDPLLTPTIACPPFPVGLDNPTEIAGKPVDAYAWIPFTYPFNMTGQPASSVPCGFTKDGLPIGLQIVGRRFDDATVLRASAAFERARPWAQHRPVLD